MKVPIITSRGWIRTFLIGLICWTIFTIFYAVITYIQVRIPFLWALSSSFLFYYTMAALSIAVWYYTKWILFRFPWQLQLIAHAFGSVGYSVSWFFLHSIFFQLLMGYEIYQESKFDENALWLIGNTMAIYGVFVGIIYVLQYYRRLREQEQREQELRLHSSKMELAILKSQLNPHFLFNTLNAINALVGSNPEGARRVLSRLADVLRYSLDSDREQFVSLNREIEFTKSYLEIEKERFGDRLRIHWEIDSNSLNILVPPMALQPIVENAIKHGIEPSESGGDVWICTKRLTDNLLVEVIDNGVGTINSTNINLLSNGRGLSTTDLRLRKLFGENAGLKINPRSENSNSIIGFKVSFQIPILTS